MLHTQHLEMLHINNNGVSPRGSLHSSTVLARRQQETAGLEDNRPRKYPVQKCLLVVASRGINKESLGVDRCEYYSVMTIAGASITRHSVEIYETFADSRRSERVEESPKSKESGTVHPFTRRTWWW